MASSKWRSRVFYEATYKAIRSAQAEGRDWRKDLSRFLLNYRATPHSTTGVTPAELLFGWKIATKLPDVQPDHQARSPIDDKIQVKDSKSKQKMKEYADKRSKAQENEIVVGDTVLVRQKKRNKFTTRFDPSPYQVVEEEQ